MYFCVIVCVCVCVAQITGLIIITLAFLTSLLLLLMYKAMWYDQLTCPEGFILQVRNTHLNTHEHTHRCKSMDYMVWGKKNVNIDHHLPAEAVHIRVLSLDITVSLLHYSG